MNGLLSTEHAAQAFLRTRADLPLAEVLIDSGPMIEGSDVRIDFIAGLCAMRDIPNHNRGILAWRAVDLLRYQAHWIK